MEIAFQTCENVPNYKTSPSFTLQKRPLLGPKTFKAIGVPGEPNVHRLPMREPKDYDPFAFFAGKSQSHTVPSAVPAARFIPSDENATE